MEGFIAKAGGEGKKLNITGDPFVCKAVGEDTANGWSLFEATVHPGSLVPAHKHDGFDEAFYILEGELEMSVAGEKTTASAGFFINILRGTVHGYQNTTSAQARALTWTHPAGIEHFYEDLDQEIKTLPEDLEKIVGIAERHNIQLMPPSES